MQENKQQKYQERKKTSGLQQLHTLVCRQKKRTTNKQRSQEDGPTYQEETEERSIKSKNDMERKWKTNL